MSWFFPNHCVPEGQESRRAVLADSYCEAAVDHSEGCRQPREIQSLAHWLESVPCSSVVGRIPESMRLAQHCRSDTCFTLVVAAPSELIDDQAPWLYDLLRIVRKSCGYECVRFTQFYFLGDDPLVPAVATGGGHRFGHIAQRGWSVA